MDCNQTPFSRAWGFYVGGLETAHSSANAGTTKEFVAAVLYAQSIRLNHLNDQQAHQNHLVIIRINAIIALLINLIYFT